MTGNNYTFEDNTISLILFADGVTYNKSEVNSMWTILSEIVELPPILRGSFENILFHSSWTGSQPDFNVWLKNYNNQIDTALKNGFEWKNKKFNLKIHAFIADSPARSKVCNSIQFNGYYGCIKCMHPGTCLNKVILYPNLDNIKLRTNENYNLQVEKAIVNNCCFEGIKGSSYISNWITIPDNVIFDYMHLSLVGTFKKMFNSFFDQSNWQEKYYLSIFFFFKYLILNYYKKIKPGVL